MADGILEPCPVAAAYVDGLAAVRIDEAGVARVNLYADQIGAAGEAERILTARLVMSRDVLRKIADRMLTESMVANHLSARAEAELRQKMI